MTTLEWPRCSLTVLAAIPPTRPKSRESVTQPVECQLGQAVFPNQPTEVLGNHIWGKRRTINVGEDISGVLPDRTVFELLGHLAIPNNA